MSAGKHKIGECKVSFPFMAFEYIWMYAQGLNNRGISKTWIEMLADTHKVLGLFLWHSLNGPILLLLSTVLSFQLYMLLSRFEISIKLMSRPKNKSHWFFDCVVLLIPSTNFWDRQWSIGQMDCLFWGRSKENRFSHFNPFQAKQTSVWPEGLTISSSSSKPISDGD